MFTEDNAESAAATGKMIGLSGKVVTGKSISESVKYGTELPLDADIYARVTPEQKLYVIEQMKKSGQTVAMTGTRPEDAEAMERSDIGITISENTTGSAYEAADVIMHDDNFSAIAGMIASARQVHRNIKRASAVMISGYLALVLLNMLNLFGDAQLMLNPAIIAILTMFVLPAAALADLDNHADMRGFMPPSEFITNSRINYRFILLAVIVGALCGAVSIASYMFMYNGTNVEFARSCALLSFGFCTSLFTFINLGSGKSLRWICLRRKTGGYRRSCTCCNFGSACVHSRCKYYFRYDRNRHSGNVYLNYDGRYSCAGLRGRAFDSQI